MVENNKKAAVVVKDLNKIFHDEQRGEIKAVNNLNFECYPGEIFGLLGPNGAGKTTTLRMVSTLMKPDSGSVTVNGYDTQKESDNVRKSIGYLSTSTALYPRLSPRETLEYFARLNDYPEDKIEKRINDIVNKLEIGEFVDTQVNKFSTGMKQITSIARTIIHNPPVLILDEPSSGLDVLVADRMHKYIKNFKEEGKAVIFSSHNMGEVEKVCDRIGIINKGQLLALGTIDELREQSGKHYLEDIFIHFVNSVE